jgi:hypothetical protein
VEPFVSDPQAWATEVPFFWMTTRLGLHVDDDGALGADPVLPERFRALTAADTSGQRPSSSRVQATGTR